MRRALDWLVVDAGGRTAGVISQGWPVMPAPSLPEQDDERLAGEQAAGEWNVCTVHDLCDVHADHPCQQ